jgi:hypothetical protein
MMAYFIIVGIESLRGYDLVRLRILAPVSHQPELLTSQEYIMTTSIHRTEYIHTVGPTYDGIHILVIYCTVQYVQYSHSFNE